MRTSVGSSIALHVAAVVVGVVGLPHIPRPPEVDTPPIVAELVTIADITNVPTKPKEPEPPKEQPKAEPPKPPPPPQKTEAPAPPPKPEPVPEVAAVPPEPKPEAKKEEPKKEEPPKPRPPEELAKLKATKKPAPPKEDFDAVLKNLQKSLPQKAEPKAEAKKAEPNFDELMAKAIPSNRRNIGDPTKPISMTEEDAIKNAIRRAMQQCWNVPAGAKDAANLVINLRMSLSQDGTVTNVQLEDSLFGKSDFWRAAADSALRAVRVCSPFKDLPRDRYDAWKEITMTFNPKEMLGG
jgi:outer membrane biosynthesis protein TonB